ncbi:MAG TPA: hypothetical protein VIV15_04145 [Anaerolineales bacterium]
MSGGIAVYNPLMGNKGDRLFTMILAICCLLDIGVFFMYRGERWPLGMESIEALGALGILLLTLVLFLFHTRLNSRREVLRDRSLAFGLMVGSLWTMEIAMNNLLAPPLPSRDIYDNIFWAIVAACIFIYSLYRAMRDASLKRGILAGTWSGLATGSVACMTALAFIVFGMNFILRIRLTWRSGWQEGPRAIRLAWLFTLHMRLWQVQYCTWWSWDWGWDFFLGSWAGCSGRESCS